MKSEYRVVYRNTFWIPEERYLGFWKILGWHGWQKGFDFEESAWDWIDNMKEYRKNKGVKKIIHEKDRNN